MSNHEPPLTPETNDLIRITTTEAASHINAVRESHYGGAYILHEGVSLNIDDEDGIITYGFGDQLNTTLAIEQGVGYGRGFSASTLISTHSEVDPDPIVVEAGHSWPQQAWQQVYITPIEPRQPREYLNPERARLMVEYARFALSIFDADIKENQARAMRKVRIRDNPDFPASRRNSSAATIDEELYFKHLDI